MMRKNIITKYGPHTRRSKMLSLSDAVLNPSFLTPYE